MISINTFINKHNTSPSFQDPGLLSKLEDKLQISENSKKSLQNDRCDVCDTHLSRLRQEAIAMVQSINPSNNNHGNTNHGNSMVSTPASSSSSSSPPEHLAQQQQHRWNVAPSSSASAGQRMMPRTTPHYSSAHHRYGSLALFIPRKMLTFIGTGIYWD